MLVPLIVVFHLIEDEKVLHLLQEIILICSTEIFSTPRLSYPISEFTFASLFLTHWLLRNVTKEKKFRIGVLLQDLPSILKPAFFPYLRGFFILHLNYDLKNLIHAHCSLHYAKSLPLLLLSNRWWWFKWTETLCSFIS